MGFNMVSEKLKFKSQRTGNLKTV